MTFLNNKQLNRTEKDEEKKAFSLIEVILSVTIFTVIMLSMTGIFKMVIDAQRKAIAAQNVQESLKYFLEVINKEIRMAIRPDGGNIYLVSSGIDNDRLSFKNRHGQPVTYFVTAKTANNPNRFKISRLIDGAYVEDFISPAKIVITSLRFELNQSPDSQEMVTIRVTAKPLGSSSSEDEMAIQTSISSRYYRD